MDKGNPAANLSFRRKLAIQSIKEKLDQQAATLNSKELAANDLMQGVRRQEKLINQCKELLEQAERAPSSSSTAMAELQRVYDKYQKIYGPRRQRTATKTNLQRDMISEMIDAEDKFAFEQKWMDRLDDVDRELDGDNHRKDGDPVLGRYSRFPVGA